jgi:predicted metal-binding membrane protein
MLLMRQDTGRLSAVAVTMEKMIQAVAQRDRLVVGVALVGIAGVAWYYLAHEAEKFAATGVCQCAAMMIGGPDLAPWSPQTLLPLFLMWAEMMVAMMLPAVTPLVLLFSKVARARAERGQPYVSTAFFVSGYFAVWTAFSVGAAVAQWVLHGTALLSPQMTASSSILSGALLVTAGAFQFSPLKSACLAHCRSPLTFLMTNWSDGRTGAFLMGWKHGWFCTACCWLLMLLLLVVGVMNLLWIALLALFALSERVAPKAWRLSQISGLVLLGAGMWLLAAPLFGSGRS